MNHSCLATHPTDSLSQLCSTYWLLLQTDNLTEVPNFGGFFNPFLQKYFVLMRIYWLWNAKYNLTKVPKFIRVWFRDGTIALTGELSHPLNNVWSLNDIVFTISCWIKSPPVKFSTQFSNCVFKYLWWPFSPLARDNLPHPCDFPLHPVNILPLNQIVLEISYWIK